jgi:glycosyltransferase involved in cell wall biosynthesis
MPAHLSALYVCLENEPSMAVVYASLDPRGVDAAGLFARNPIEVSDTLMRAEAARAVGGFSLTGDTHADWDFWLRMAERFAIVQLPRDLTTRRPRPRPSHRAIAQTAEQARFRERMTNARRTYGQRRARTLTPFNPDTWRDGRRELIMQAPFTNGMSFGIVTRELALGLEARGVDISVGPLRADAPAGWERFYERRGKRGGEQDRLAFYFDFRVGPCALLAEHIVRYTMWESTLVPHEQITETNAHCAFVYVPCRQNAAAFRACGLRTPLKILPHGVNFERFPLLERPRDGSEPYTFGAIGTFSPRKGIDVLIRAFADEFRPSEHVRLVLKATNTDHALPRLDPRIEFVEGFFDDEVMLQLMGRFDAFVLPSRGEGFGLPGVEAMATGLPLIATNWSGPADYLDPADSFPLDYELVNPGGAGAHGTRFWGEWAEPSYEHLRCLLRQLFENRAEAAAKGAAAAARMRRDWTWERVVDALYEDLDKLAQGMTPGNLFEG